MSSGIMLSDFGQEVNVKVQADAAHLDSMSLWKES